MKKLCLFLFFVQTYIFAQTNVSIDINQTQILNTSKLDFSLFSLYENADITVKCVIYILIFASIVSWGIFIGKILQIYLYNISIKKDKKRIINAKYLSDLVNFKYSSFVSIFKNEVEDEVLKSKNIPNLQNRIKIRLEIRLNKFISRSRNFLSLLASVGSTAPFIGLFGTVWGIMNSFIGIANSNNTGLDVVAPGIAEALFATAFGLAAAIPAVLFYNCTLRKITKFSENLDEIVTMIFVITDRTLNEKKEC